MKVENNYKTKGFYDDQINAEIDTGLIYTFLSALNGPDKKELSLEDKARAFKQLVAIGYSKAKNEYCGKYPDGDEEGFQQYINECGFNVLLLSHK